MEEEQGPKSLLSYEDYLKFKLNEEKWRQTAPQSEKIGLLTLALSKAQGKFKPLKRNVTVTVKMRDNKGEYSYKYTSLDEVEKCTQEALEANELSIEHILNHEPDGKLWMTTILSHSSDQFLRSRLIVPLDTSGHKNAIQQMGSSITYLRRYAYCCLLGVSSESDDDGRTAGQGNSPQAKGGQEERKPAAKKKGLETTDQKNRKKGLAAMHAAAEDNDWTETDLKSIICKSFNVDSRTKLTVKNLQWACKTIREFTPIQAAQKMIEKKKEAEQQQEDIDAVDGKAKPKEEPKPKAKTKAKSKPKTKPKKKEEKK